MRPDADPFTIAGNAGHVATGEDVAGTEEYENATDNGSPSAGVFHADQSQFANDKLSSGGTDFRLKEQLSPALRQEVEQIKADIAAKQALKAAEVGGTLTDVQETDTRAEAQAPPKVGAERGRGASGRAVQAEVPTERPIAFEVGQAPMSFTTLPEDRFQGFQEVGTLREALSI